MKSREVRLLKPDPVELRRHYASLPDETLLGMVRAELTELAQRCYDDELASRNIVQDTGFAESEADSSSHSAETKEGEVDWTADPDWLSEAVCACSFDEAAEMDKAREILDKAGIPCHSVNRPMDSQSGHPTRFSYELMVPGALSLRTASVLDQEYFNPQQETEWRTHLEALTDEDFHALRLEDVTAGLQDRIARLTSVFNDELARRRAQ